MFNIELNKSQKCSLTLSLLLLFLIQTEREREKEKRGMATFLVNTSINNSPLKRKRSNINNKKEEEE
jgi:hypothetical protein